MQIQYLVLSNLDGSENGVLENYDDFKCGSLGDKNSDDGEACEEFESNCLMNIYE